ncbi:MAG: hypothetical protein AMXMBFR7_39590 [Planctomycetota bacterium]
MKTATDHTHEADDLPPDLREAGEAVRKLPLPAVPADLAARTLARAQNLQAAASAPRHEAVASKRFEERPWWLRPITSPMGRAAAAVVLAVTLVAVTNPRSAERLGVLVGQWIGERNTDKLDHFVDRVLTVVGPRGVALETPETPAPARPNGARGPHTAAPAGMERA